MSYSGKVKWYNPTKGYGFIVPDGGGNDIFVHATAVESSGLRKLDEGQALSYEISDNNGKISAINIKPA